MDLDEVKRLIQMMNENELAELEIESEGMKVRLRKSGQERVSFTPVVQQVHPQAVEPAASKAAPEAKTEPTQPQKGYLTIPSPMVGTFYAAPSPEADPFVEPGTIVEPETVVCIIEAMKVMNEIKAEVTGKIVEVLVSNGDAVDYGQPLFLVEPTA